MHNPFIDQDVITMDEIKTYKNSVKDNNDIIEKIDILISDMGWSNDLIKKSFFSIYVLELIECEGENAAINPEDYINITYQGVDYFAR
jgi:hypothetical protein